jgi:hypothetical protein
VQGHKKNPQLSRQRQLDLVYDFKALPGSVILSFIKLACKVQGHKKNPQLSRQRKSNN